MIVLPCAVALALSTIASHRAVVAPQPPARVQYASAKQAAPRHDPRLQAKLETLVKGFHGDVGVYVHHLKSGRAAGVRADDVFPTASIVKVPILVGVFDAIERGSLTFDQMLVYRDSLKYSGDDIVGNLRDSSTIAVSKLTLLMITTSDNTASLWLQGLVGGATINRWLGEHGYDSTRINSRVPGREDARRVFGWGQTTPREMARLVSGIRAGAVVSAPASEEMYRHLSRIYWNAEALSQLPPWVQTASKQGMVNRARGEVVLVNAPSGDYVFAVNTKNQADSSWTLDNEGYALIRNISAMLWKEFEPKHPYTPAPEVRKFKPSEEP